VIGQLAANQSVNLMSRNATSDWWRIVYPSEEQAWVSGQVIEVRGGEAVTVAQNIPVLPTATTAPTRPPVPTQQIQGEGPAVLRTPMFIRSVFTAFESMPASAKGMRHSATQPPSALPAAKAHAFPRRATASRGASASSLLMKQPSG
jgi:hypothetical protein